jgi:nucleotide-binding universal stress UspA family protein
MIKTIVVPVDRTEKTKTALNIAVWLSLLCGSRLLLLGISHREPKVVREFHPAHGDVILSEDPDIFREGFAQLWTYPNCISESPGEMIEKVTFDSDEEQDLEAYLSNLQKEITGSHLHHKLPSGRVSRRVENGPLDQALKDLHAEEPVDLVVLSAHHESVLRNLLFSSQPNQILRQDRLPVLVIPQGFKLSTFTQFENETLPVNLKLYLKPTKGHLLVTLDGTATAEAALPLAAELAEKMNVSLYLLLVLPLDSRRISFDRETSH